MIAIIIIVVILAALLLLPVGVALKYDDEEVFLSARAGPLKMKILPQKEESEAKREKKAAKKARRAEKKTSKPKKERTPLTRDELLELIKLGLKALGRFRRKLSVDLLRIYWTAAAGDPYDAAMQFGYVSAAMGTLIPLIENAFKIRERDVRSSLNFESEKPYILAELTATIQVWEILHIALAFGAEYLRMKRKMKRRLRKKAAEEERKINDGKNSDK